VIKRSLVALAPILILAACGSSESSERDAAEAGARATVSATNVGPQGWPRVEGLRGGRYCEVLLLRIVDGDLVADVWNSYSLGGCPDDDWAALDAEAIKAERAVLAALLNGPRYWLMDAIERQLRGERELSTFGAIEMFLAATVNLGPPPPDLTPYTERRVARGTVFEFSAGSEVYELVDPEGRVFVMQSYSVQRDATLSEDALSGLGDLIRPPQGWAFRSRVLDRTLRIENPTVEAPVLQDELGNTYSLVESE
jgi:hypothetical protein